MGLLGYLFATAVRILLSLAFWGAVGLSIMGLNPNAAVQEKLKQTVGTKTAQDILNAADVLASILKRVNSHLAVYTGPVYEAVVTWLNEESSAKSKPVQTWSKRRKGKASRPGGSRGGGIGDEKECGEEGEARASQAKSTPGGGAKVKKEVVDKRADRGGSAQPRAGAAAGALPRQRGVVGTTVEARYHGSGEWLRATIVGVLQGTQGGFRVQYTDGEREELASQWVRTPGYKSFVGAVVGQETYSSSDNDEEPESEESSEDEGSRSSWLAAAGARVGAAAMAASYDFDGGATDDGWQLVNPTRTISKPRPPCPASSSTLPMPACESSSSASASWTRTAKPRSSASTAPTSGVDATLKNRKKREKKREKELMVRTLKQLHGSA